MKNIVIKILLRLLKTKNKGEKMCYRVDIMSNTKLGTSSKEEEFSQEYFFPKLALKLIKKQIEIKGCWEIEPNDFPKKEKMFVNLNWGRGK